MSVGRAGRPDRSHAGRHRTGADEDHLVAERARSVDDLAAQIVDDALVDDAELVRQRRRADLRDDAHQRSVLVLEAEARDPHDVAVTRAGAGEHLRHAEALQLEVDVRQRLGRGDVVERDHPLHLPADQSELVLAEALDASALDLRADDHDALGRRLLLAGLVHERGQAPDELAHALTRDRRDGLSAPRVDVLGARHVGSSCRRPPVGARAARAGSGRAPRAGSAPARADRPRPSARGPPSRTAREPARCAAGTGGRGRVPSLAPSIRPGMSATTKFGVLVDPRRRRGSAPSVVNG